MQSIDIINTSLQALVFSSGLCTSKSTSKKLIKSGGLYLNNVRITDPKHIVTPSDIIGPSHGDPDQRSIILLRSGKRNYKMVSFEG